MTMISSWRKYLLEKSNDLIKSPYNRPEIINYGSIASARKIVISMNQLASQTSTSSLEKAISQSIHLNNKQSEQLQLVTKNINKLRKNLQILSNEQIYTNTKGRLIAGSNLKVKSLGASINEYTITVKQIASQHMVASSQIEDPSVALGIEGYFRINGTRIQVETSDSLTDISNKVNYGEDTDRNGILGWDEDTNANGIIDTYGNAGNLYPDAPFSEDYNANGILDSSEDINSNNKLDGGTAEHLVTSYIKDNRLVLRSTQTGSTLIRLEDENNILHQIGILNKNIYGDSEIQYELEAAQNAIFTINGQVFTSSTNVVTDAIENLEITLLEASSDSSRVKITADSNSLKKEINNFITTYNNLISSINQELKNYQNIQGKKDLENLKINLSKNITEPVADPKQNEISNIKEIGINELEIPAQKISQPQLDNLITKNNINQDRPLNFLLTQLASGVSYAHVNSIISGLGNLGIISYLDGNLVIDNKKLETTLNKKLPEVKKLFIQKNEGIIPKMKNYIDIATNTNFGDINTAKEKINAFLEEYNQLETQTKIMLERYSIQNAVTSELNSNLNLFSGNA